MPRHGRKDEAFGEARQPLRRAPERLFSVDGENRRPHRREEASVRAFGFARQVHRFNLWRLVRGAVRRRRRLCRRAVDALQSHRTRHHGHRAHAHEPLHHCQRPPRARHRRNQRIRALRAHHSKISALSPRHRLQARRPRVSAAPRHLHRRSRAPGLVRLLFIPPRHRRRRRRHDRHQSRQRSRGFRAHEFLRRRRRLGRRLGRSLLLVALGRVRLQPPRARL